MTYALWQRNRIGLTAIAVFLVIFGSALAIAGRRLYEAELVLGSLTVALSYLFLIAVFIHQDSDVGAARSSYPSYMFTLPVKTVKLVFAPMLGGTVTVFGFGFLLSGASRLAGFHLALWWPALFAATVVAVLQAVFWFPWGIPYTKLLLTLLALPGLGVAIGWPLDAGVSEGVLCAELVAIIAVSYAVAYVGVARARRGDSREFGRTRAAAKATKPVVERKPFRSAAQAQRWYEWREQGIVLPAVAASLTLLFYIPMLWNTTLSPVSVLERDANGLLPTAPTYVTVYYPVLLVLILCVSWIMGCGLKRSAVKRGDRTFQLFYGTRPMSDADLVGAKLKSTAVSTLWAWGLVILLSLPILTLDGGYQDMMRMVVYPDHKPLFLILPHFIDGRAVFVIVTLLALLMLITWRNYVIGFWTELSGKLWLRYAYIVAFLASYFSLVIWGSTQREMPPWLSFALFVGAIWFALTLKYLVAAGLFYKHLREGRLTPKAALRCAAFYTAACIVLVVVGMNLSLSMRQAYVQFGLGRPIVVDSAMVALILLWTPLTRMLAASEMLTMNRHRKS